MRFKPGDLIVYYGSDKKLHGAFGTIKERFGRGKWRVKLDGMAGDYFAEEKDLQPRQLAFDFDTDRFLDDLM